MLDYKTAGVDIEAGYKSVELMKKHVKETMRPEVLGGLGGFAGAFDLSGIKNMEEPVLLSGTDGCGTKVKLAFVMDKHDTIGIDTPEDMEKALAFLANRCSLTLLFNEYSQSSTNRWRNNVLVIPPLLFYTIYNGCNLGNSR